MANHDLITMKSIVKRLSEETKLKLQLLLKKDLTHDRYLIDMCDKFGPISVAERLEHLVKDIDLGNAIRNSDSVTFTESLTLKEAREKYNYEPKQKFQWDIPILQELGFTLIEKQGNWCRMKGHNFEIHFFPHPESRVSGQRNHFTFKALGNRYWKGNFSARIESIQEFKTLLKMLNNV